MSPQKPVEMILLRQLASYLTMAILITDAEGNLVYYNEPAEKLLGVTFDDAGPIHADQLSDMFRATNLDGTPLVDSALPIVASLSNQSPAYGQIRFCGMDGVWRDIEVSAFPLEGQASRFLGVFATFWELHG